MCCLYLEYIWNLKVHLVLQKLFITNKTWLKLSVNYCENCQEATNHCNCYWSISVSWDQREVRLKSLHLFATPNWFWLTYWLSRWLQLHLRHPPAKSRGFPSPPVSGAGKIISWRNSQLRPLTSFEETDVCVCVCVLALCVGVCVLSVE